MPDTFPPIHEATRAYEAWVARMAPTAKLFGPSSLNSTVFTTAISPSVKNLYVSIPGFLPKDLPAAGKAFVSAFKTAFGHDPDTEAIFGWEAMSAVLEVLKKAGRGADIPVDRLAYAALLGRPARATRLDRPQALLEVGRERPLGAVRRHVEHWDNALKPTK